MRHTVLAQNSGFRSALNSEPKNSRVSARSNPSLKSFQKSFGAPFSKGARTPNALNLHTLLRLRTYTQCARQGVNFPNSPGDCWEKRGRPAREVAPLKRASDSATLFKRIFLKKELTSRPYIRYTIKLRVFAFISRFFSIRRSLKDGPKKGRAVVMYRFLYHWRTSYTSESFRRKAAGSRKSLKTNRSKIKRRHMHHEKNLPA